MNCSKGDWACELSRIADAMNAFDWNSFAATLLATLVGAGVAAGVSFWLAERDRPRPMWKVDARIESAFAQDGVFTIEVTVTNIGDGAAYHPRVHVQGRDVTGRRRSEAALVEPGGEFNTWIGVPGTGQRGTHHETLELYDTREIDWSGGVTADLAWHQPPRRTRTKHTRMRLDPPTK